jgi:transglutaminase-like putative cysteine protease
MTATARRGLPRPRARAGYAAPLLPPAWARLVGFAPLVVFCACMWARTLEPARLAEMLAAAGVAIAAAAALLAVRGPWRFAVAVAAVAGALLAAGVAPRLLLPGNWDELAAGLGGAIGDLPTTNVPYRGADAWSITVLLLIGGLLAILAAWLAFGQRRAGGLRGPGPAAVALGVLFTVPAVQVEDGHPWLQGIVLAVLLCAFLRLERIERHGAPTALAVVAVAGVAAAVAAPRLDVGRPLLDPEALANALAPARGLQFAWNHDYGALHWPRSGREVLRIKATTASYWKVENLSRFDGLRWIEPRELGPTEPEASMRASQRDWRSDIHVRVRGFSSRLFVGAGTTLAITSSPRTPLRNAPGTFRTGPRPLHEGHSYDATVWNPRPTKSQLRNAEGELPAWTWPYLRIDLPTAQGGPLLRPPRGTVLRSPQTAQVSFPGYAIDSPPFVDSRWPGQAPMEVEDVLRRSAYGGVYRLAEQLREGTSTPYEYVKRVLDRLADGGYVYSEEPPPSDVPLASFLLDDKQGYCQQFSGAMALLLRMEGVPARVATGFSPGTPDRDTGEFVVRDTDAHSWVEAYIAPYGWVTFDPTPPVGPARLDPGVGAAGAYALAAPAGVLGAGERVGDRDPGGGKVDDGSPLPWILAGVVALVLVVTAALLVRRRRRGPPPPDSAVAELLAALEGTGRTATGGLTLQTMQRRYRGTPAEPYLRTLEAARFAGSDVAPTPAMRSAMRRELVLGLGPAARFGAWRAIPPALIRTSRPRSTYPDGR